MSLRSSTGETGNALELFQRCQERVSVQLSAILHKLAISDSEAAQLPHNSTKVNKTPAGIRDEHFNVSLAEESPEILQITGAEKEPSTTEKVAQELSTIITCQKNCPCQCHLKRRFKSPWALRVLFGQLNMQYNLQQARPGCRCKGTSSIQIICQFPAFLIRRYVFFAMNQSLAAGPEFLLRVPRVAPWAHMLWRYLANGDLQAIQRLYAERLASPYDITLRVQMHWAMLVDSNHAKSLNFC